MPHQQSGGILHTVSAARRTVSDHSETHNVLKIWFNSQLYRP